MSQDQTIKRWMDPAPVPACETHETSGPPGLHQKPSRRSPTPRRRGRGHSRTHGEAAATCPPVHPGPLTPELSWEHLLLVKHLSSTDTYWAASFPFLPLHPCFWINFQTLVKFHTDLPSECVWGALTPLFTTWLPVQALPKPASSHSAIHSVLPDCQVSAGASSQHLDPAVITSKREAPLHPQLPPGAHNRLSCTHSCPSCPRRPPLHSLQPDPCRSPEPAPGPLSEERPVPDATAGAPGHPGWITLTAQGQPSPLGAGSTRALSGCGLAQLTVSADRECRATSSRLSSPRFYPRPRKGHAG